MPSYNSALDSFYGFMPAADSGNSKLGNVNYVYAPKENCSDSCPFKGNGCYGDNYPIKWQADKMTSGESKRSVTWPQLIAALRRIARDEKVRLWVDGDFPRWHKGVDISKAIELGNALHGKKAWAYTHHHPQKNERGGWAGTIRHYLERCFTINISCERPEHVDEYISQGLPCVIAVPSTETRRQWRTPEGNRVRVCPNQIDKDIQCDRCMLCHKRPADMAIAFIAHGTKKKQVDAALAA